MALRAVVLPAPLGPIRPRIRPSSTFRSRLSSATVAPKVFRRPCASMHAISSTLLVSGIGLRGVLGGSAVLVEEFFRLQAQPLDGFVDLGPFISQEFLTLALQEKVACTGLDEETETSPLLNQFFVHELLIALQDRERVHAIVGRDVTHGR